MTESAARRSAPEPSQARCQRCGETFVIADGLLSSVLPADASPELLHGRRRDGELCGGIGVPFRPYIIRNPNR